VVVSVFGYKYGRVPEELLYSSASDRACRLHAVLTRRSDTKPDEHPTRRELAALLHCSVDSVDRALKELEATGYLKIIPRYAEGVRIASDYVVDGGSRTDAGGSRTDAATITSANGEPAGDGGRTGAVGGGRTGAAVIRKEIEVREEQKKKTPAAPSAPEAKKTRKVQDHPEAQRLCDLLADLIAENSGGDRPYPRGKPAPQKWRDDVRLMLTADQYDKGPGGHYSLEQVEWMIRWSQGDSFEAKVVQSMPKLRTRRRVLTQKAAEIKAANGNGHRNGHHTEAVKAAERAERDRQLAVTQARMARSRTALEYDRRHAP